MDWGEGTTATFPRINRKWTTLLHSVGLSSIGAALFLQVTVFSSILKNGYFMGVEQNPLILTAELTLTGIAVAYFAYVIVRFLVAHR